MARVAAPAAVLIVSVAGHSVRAALAHWIQQTWAIDAEFAAPSAAAFGVRNAYAEPERMGADRWVAMIAARALTGQTSYIVDCGTAVVRRALAADGQHLGGVIFPGIRLMREALYRETRQIPQKPAQCAYSAIIRVMESGAERSMQSRRRLT